jgi:hypothetical protein
MGGKKMNMVENEVKVEDALKVHKLTFWEAALIIVGAILALEF